MKFFLNKRSKDILALIFVAIIYSTLGIPIRLLSIKFTLFQQLYLWLFIAAGLCLILFRNKIRFYLFNKLSKKDIIISIFRAVFYYVLGYFLWSFGISHGKYSNIAIINTLPVMTLFGVLLLKEKINGAKSVAFLLSFVGTIMIVVKTFSLGLAFGIGELSALISIFFFPLSTIARKWQSHKLNNYESTFLILIIAAFINLFISLFLGEKLHLEQFSSNVILLLIILGLQNVLVLFFLNFAFENVEIVVGSIILCLETAFGIIVSIILYKEMPTFKEFIGGILIVISAFLIRPKITKKNRKKSKKVLL